MHFSSAHLLAAFILTTPSLAIPKPQAMGGPFVATVDRPSTDCDLSADTKSGTDAVAILNRTCTISGADWTEALPALLLPDKSSPSGPGSFSADGFGNIDDVLTGIKDAIAEAGPDHHKPGDIVPNPYDRTSSDGKIEIKIDFGDNGHWRYDAMAEGLSYVGATISSGQFLSKKMVGLLYAVGDPGTVVGRYWVTQVEGGYEGQ